MNEKWKGRKVLVTGAGGFIGSRLVEILMRSGAQVRAFVRYNSRGDAGLLRTLSPFVLEGIEITPGDLRDEDAVRKAVNGNEVVFHLGALISIPYSYLHPAEVASTNIMGTMNVLLACRDLGVERLVHTSTSEVYGTARIAPINESHPYRDNRLIRPARSGLINWRKVFTARMTCLSSRCAPSIRTDPLNRRGRSFPPSSPRRSHAISFTWAISIPAVTSPMWMTRLPDFCALLNPQPGSARCSTWVAARRYALATWRRR